MTATATRLLRAFVGTALLATGAAHAGHVSWSIGIHAPVAPGVTVGTVFSNGSGGMVHATPVYAPAPVVYAPPPVVYAPAPVVYAPAPVAYLPPPRVIVRPAPVYVPVAMAAPHKHWRHRHHPGRHQRWDDRRHDRDDDDHRGHGRDDGDGRWHGRSDGWRR